MQQILVKKENGQTLNYILIYAISERLTFILFQ